MSNTVHVTNQREWNSLPDSFDEFTIIEIRSSETIVILKNPENSSIKLHGNSSAELYNNSSIKKAFDGSVILKNNQKVKFADKNVSEDDITIKEIIEVTIRTYGGEEFKEFFV